jgi:hypothetical protein
MEWEFDSAATTTGGLRPPLAILRCAALCEWPKMAFEIRPAVAVKWRRNAGARNGVLAQVRRGSVCLGLASRGGGKPAGPSWAGSRSRTTPPPHLACFHFRRVLPRSVGERPRIHIGRFSERRRHGASREVLACNRGSCRPCRFSARRARRSARLQDAATNIVALLVVVEAMSR